MHRAGWSLRVPSHTATRLDKARIAAWKESAC
ncbi:winged helix-turn-helix domain-containing protein [Streptomyces hyaluromycini]|uniref:Winged helix-turn-helix domain-containing protein n=1 Tax=Streptomyces hyaluromycini TaxID=1377993 RepID=A0ABV1X104_9ACTN